MLLAGLRGTPHAGDVLRVTASEARSRAVSEARAERAQQRHHRRLEELAQDHYEMVVDEATGEQTKCVLHMDSCAHVLNTSLMHVYLRY